MIALLAVGTVVAPAFAGNVTVGRFYTELAQAKHLVAADAASAEASLRSAGIGLPKLALGKSLTEGDMSSISKALGVAVTTQRPSQLISDTQLNTFMATFGSRIGARTATVGNPADANIVNDLPPQSDRGHGKKKGHSKVSTEPQ